MHAFELLKLDHDHVSQLFNELEMAHEQAEKENLIQEIRQALDIHAYIEETFFYPLFQDKAEFQELIDDALDDHQEVKDLLDEIVSIPVDEDEMDNRLGELIESVESHVEMEENDLFPKIEHHLNIEELEKIGQQMLDAKRRMTETEAA